MMRFVVVGWVKRSATQHAQLHRLVLLLLLLAAGAPINARAQSNPVADLARLVAAYPTFLDRIDGNALVWKDGTRMPIDDGRGAKDHETLLATADIKDMFFQPYVAGRPSTTPARNADPGRARNAALFDKMYGDCTAGGVADNLVHVVWLPRKSGKVLKVSRINGAAEKLAAVSAELDALPARFDPYLFPSAGTYNCRPIAGTTRVSAHGHAIAIDIALKHAHYWRWSTAGKSGVRPRPAPSNSSAGRVDAGSDPSIAVEAGVRPRPAAPMAKPGGLPAGSDPAITYKNAIPFEIVEIFERHGFIWGGKWYHYDTMHFEYRPELIDGAR